MFAGQGQFVDRPRSEGGWSARRVATTGTLVLLAGLVAVPTTQSGFPLTSSRAGGLDRPALQAAFSPAANPPAVLLSSSPTAGSRLAGAPSTVQLTFSSWPDLLSQVAVVGPSGQTVSLGGPLVLANTTTSALAEGLPNGHYVVLYTADFGFAGTLGGQLGFDLGPAPTPAPSTKPAARSPGPRAAGTLGTTPAATPSATHPAGGTVRRTDPSLPATASPAAAVSGGAVLAGGRSPGGGSFSRDRTSDRSATAGSAATGGTHSGARRPGAGSTGGGLPVPPPLVIGALLLALAGFLADRWWGGRRDRLRSTRNPVHPHATG